MNVYWTPPVAIEDLDEISLLIGKSTPIVALLADFRGGGWKPFFEEHVCHGTDFFVHLDANFLSHLLSLFSCSYPSEHARVAAGMLCFAVTFDMKVNPTFATHEYAFSGSDPPDSRLAGFRYLDNLHPQRLANIALGREHGVLPSIDSLPRTPFFGTHQRHLRGRGLAYASLLKIVELHRCTPGLSENNSLAVRFERAKALLDWMYHDFLFCGTPLRVADHLWGRRPTKTVLKGVDTCDQSNVIALCMNASWDLVLAENWAEWEAKRSPGDPFNLIFTFDRALRNLTEHLLVTRHVQAFSKEEALLQTNRRSWPEAMARSLTERYLEYDCELESKSRLWHSDRRPNNDRFVADLEEQVTSKLAGRSAR